MGSILRYILDRRYNLIVGLLLVVIFYAPIASGAGPSEIAGYSVAFTFFALAIILMSSKIGGLIEGFGFPPVLGQLLIGAIMGNLFLLNINFFEQIKENELLMFLSQLGVLILLFQIGLESEISKMKKVGSKAIKVAIVGVVLPFIAGYFASMYLLPSEGFATWLFLGAAFTATSVGITMSVFKDNDKVNSPEGQIVLGAAVIDDVLGLLILAVVVSMVSDPTGGFNYMEIGYILVQAIIFLFGAIVLGQLSGKYVSKLFSKISTGLGMKFTIVISFCLVFAFLADLAGLAPIIGAFAAGLILDPVHFKYYKDIHIANDVKSYVKSLHLKDSEKKEFKKIMHSHERRQLEDLIEPIGMMLIPLFFVMTGMQLDFTVFSNINVILLSLALTILAFLGKYLSGFVVSGVNKHVIGLGMTPRGEVGLVFASIGIGIGAISAEVFGIIVIVVVLTTFIAPILLNNLLKKLK